MEFPDPAASAGLVDELPFALFNFVDAVTRA